MKSKKPPADDGEKAKAIFVNDPDKLEGTMKCVGGSRSDHWNETSANQAFRTFWLAHSNDETKNRQYNAAVEHLPASHLKTSWRA
jgi:hypothetical protein